MSDETVRVGTRPARERIRRETRVHQRQCRFKILVEEIRKILGKLARREHAFVNHRAGRETGHVMIVGTGEGVAFRSMHVAVFVRHLVVADRVANALADDVQLALEFHRVSDVRALFDEDLLDDGLVAAGSFPENRAFHGHRAPAEELLPLIANHVFEDLHRHFTHRSIRGEKHAARAVIAFGWEGDALLRHFPTQKLVWHLDENPRAIAGRRIGATRAAMVHLVVHREGFQDDIMRALAFEMGDEADAASVFLT